MKTEKIDIATANLAQLRQFADIQLGLDLPKNATEAVVRAKILEVFKGGEITVVARDAAPPEGVERPAPAPVPQEVSAVPLATDKGQSMAPADPTDRYETTWVNIQIHETEEAAGSAGKEPVFVSVNGRALWIERNKPQRIKLKYLEVLDNARRQVYTYNPTTQEITSRIVPAYPFQRLADDAVAA